MLDQRAAVDRQRDRSAHAQIAQVGILEVDADVLKRRSRYPPHTRLRMPFEPANVVGLDRILDEVDRPFGELEGPNRVVWNHPEADLRDPPGLGAASELDLAVGPDPDDAVGARADPYPFGRGQP